MRNSKPKLEIWAINPIKLSYSNIEGSRRDSAAPAVKLTAKTFGDRRKNRKISIVTRKNVSRKYCNQARDLLLFLCVLIFGNQKAWIVGKVCQKVPYHKLRDILQLWLLFYSYKNYFIQEW